MDIRYQHSPDRHVDQNNEIFSEEENKDERIRMYFIDILFKVKVTIDENKVYLIKIPILPEKLWKCVQERLQ